MTHASFICPDWPAPSNIKAYTSTRLGGVSQAPFASLNLGGHVGDDTEAVTENRIRFAKLIDQPKQLRWLNQVHGNTTVTLPSSARGDLAADAAFTQVTEQVCAVMTADCLPLLMCDQAGTQVAACHAGWRGLCDGVIESCVAKFDDVRHVMVWLGPAIGPECFEVGDEVRDAFIKVDDKAAAAFTKSAHQGKWLANIYLLARQRLERLGVKQVYGGNECTFTDKRQFFSYRRDRETGRMASVIWITEKEES